MAWTLARNYPDRDVYESFDGPIVSTFVEYLNTEGSFKVSFNIYDQNSPHALFDCTFTYDHNNKAEWAYYITSLLGQCVKGFLSLPQEERTATWYNNFQWNPTKSYPSEAILLMAIDHLTELYQFFSQSEGN